MRVQERILAKFWRASRAEFNSRARSLYGIGAFRGKSVRSHCFLICHCFHRCGNLLLRGLDPEGTRDWLLRQLLWYVGIELVGFRVQQRTEESHPSLADRRAQTFGPKHFLPINKADSLVLSNQPPTKELEEFLTIGFSPRKHDPYLTLNLMSVPTPS